MGLSHAVTWYVSLHPPGHFDLLHFTLIIIFFCPRFLHSIPPGSEHDRRPDQVWSRRRRKLMNFIFPHRGQKNRDEGFDPNDERIFIVRPRVSFLYSLLLISTILLSLTSVGASSHHEPASCI